MQARKTIVLSRTLFILFITFFSASGSGESRGVAESEWEFSLIPFPHLSKHGNVTHGNQFLIMVSEGCRGDMAAYFASYNKEKLLETKGKTLPVAFSVSLADKKEVIQSTSKVIAIDNMVMGDLAMAFAISILELISVEDITQLKSLGAFQMTTFDLTAEDDKIYDIPHENWDLNGFLPALNKAIAWCEIENKGDVRHAASSVEYYVSI
jgi:hypothetical protein